MPPLERLGIILSGWEPLLDGVVPPLTRQNILPDRVEWLLAQGGTICMKMADEGDVACIEIAAEGLEASPLSLGVRTRASGVARYLRNGYHSWDGSFFAEPGTEAGDTPPGKEATLGFAMTALVPLSGNGALVLGPDRHDRFQTCFRFGGDDQVMEIEVETLLDRTGGTQSEPLFLFADDDVEGALRRWSARVAAASPLAPRLPDKRIIGWCSWYNLYASITEANITEQLAAARHYRDKHGIALDVFLIDDGFTPEMGDWLDV